MLVACLSFQLKAQTLSSDYIQKYTSYFTIENGELRGKGKKVLQKMIKSSQFITYGEIHGSKEVSLLTKAMIDPLVENDFRYFAIEVGPHSAEVLSRLSTNPDKTIERLYQFNSAYTVSAGDETAVPIPFFDNLSDAEFLQQARRMEMQLWGLDQEFYFSAFFLADELLRTVENSPEASKIKQLKDLAQQSMFKWYMAEVKEEIESPFPLMLKDKNITNFFNSFDEKNTKARAIINDLKISWDIYTRWRSGSHQDRISYMRNNFMKNYNAAIARGETPKVFTKIGSLHAPKAFSNGAYDIGFLTEELAQKNGTVSTSINTWIPFSKTEKGIVNNVDRYNSYKRYAEFLKLAKQDQYAIIDLRQIRKDVEKGKIQLPEDGSYHAIRRLIFAYDYQIMLPLTEGTQVNRETK